VYSPYNLQKKFEEIGFVTNVRGLLPHIRVKDIDSDVSVFCVYSWLISLIFEIPPTPTLPSSKEKKNNKKKPLEKK